MEIETLKTKLQYRKNYRSSDSKLLAFNLPSLIDSMKQSYTWANGELNSIILLKSPEKQIILTAIHEGTEILSFQSNDSVTVQIVEGRLKFHHRKDSFTLNKGQLMTLDENVKYDLTADEETVFLLTILNTHLRHTSN
jgi:quercetin dioxygenase-like cupin family protein